MPRVEAEEYRRMAAVEDRMWFYRALHAHIERQLSAGSASPRKILDAGCGTGGLIRRLAPRHPDWSWTGVDVELLACELARTRCAANIMQASVTALPFPDESFDAIVSADVLYHLDDDAAALRECQRVLRPGGQIVINVPAHRWLWSYHDVTVHARRRYTCRELRTKLADAGLVVGIATHWNTLALPLVVVRRKLLPAPRSGSDVQLYPMPVEALLRAATALERGWIGAGGVLPVGCSILAVATKP